ncbi:YpzG family protein [Paenisporosarcina sp. OV554]|uniref:YpzG family protein n=1 Tax=Paenisporosarcina sp. OV554 TaxID=2135694 RepID=UPI000D33CD36|nr:YpzG family protein [Paenisporosarcina sp. OV554]PUB16719.1 YpzG-like protein [Paenisporosarcina sp. OV554]
MSKKQPLDAKSAEIHHNWTRPKKSKTQVNGQTEESQSTQLLKTSAKVHSLK